MIDDNFKRAWRNAYPNGETTPINREHCDDQRVIDLAEAYDENASLKEQLAAREALIFKLYEETSTDAIREHEARLLEDIAKLVESLQMFISSYTYEAEISKEPLIAVWFDRRIIAKEAEKLKNFINLQSAKEGE